MPGVEPTPTEFASAGTTCAATYHRAAADGERPCVVLGHGFAMTRGARLDSYGARFAAAGIDALSFDYRGFGGSGGEPRQWMDVERQLEDWRAAIAHARTLPGVDPARIALWGTSFSGGHVVALAASERSVAAVISQVPFSGLGGSGGEAPRRLRRTARLIALAAADAASGRIGRGPRYIPVVCEPGEVGAFDRPGAMDQLAILIDGDPTWENRFTPRVLLQMGRYKPFAKAAQIRCPVLLVVCDPDDITPAAPALERSEPIPELEVEHFDCPHFEIYRGEHFERSVERQVGFLERRLSADRVSSTEDGSSSPS